MERMTEVTLDPYAFAAQMFYMGVAAAVVGLLLGVWLLASKSERAAIFDAWLFWTTPLLLAQVLTTILGGVLWMMGVLPAMMITLVLGQWLMLLLGLGSLPGGLILARRMKKGRNRNWGGWTATVVGATVGVLAFSLAWLAVASMLFEPQQNEMLRDASSSLPAFLVIVPIALLAAPLEEAVFRLGMQGMMESAEKKGWMPMWATLVVPSAVWALGHAGTLTPHGIKEFQIFVVGLVLGLVYRKYGFGACVAVHLGLNLGALALVPLEMLVFRSGSG